MRVLYKFLCHMHFLASSQNTTHIHKGICVYTICVFWSRPIQYQCSHLIIFMPIPTFTVFLLTYNNPCISWPPPKLPPNDDHRLCLMISMPSRSAYHSQMRRGSLAWLVAHSTTNIKIVQLLSENSRKNPHSFVPNSQGTRKQQLFLSAFNIGTKVSRSACLTSRMPQRPLCP